MEIFFATSNDHKFAEAEEMLGRAGIAIRRMPLAHNEIRSESTEEIARDALAYAYGRLGKPVFVEDAGLFIDSLNGFPGTYSGWALRKIGTAGILRLLSGSDNRAARFESCIAYTDGRSTEAFLGVCRGSIAENRRGSGGFGYDPIFIPEGRSQTFAESIQLKNNISHRYKSLLQFSNHIREHTR